MAKRKITWTKTADKQLLSTLKYWTERNKSSNYSIKLVEEIERNTALIAENPTLFLYASFDETYVCPMGHISIFINSTKLKYL